ncbi:tetratricopeptide repeat protein [bacterium]|nr:tetratricopeptide repeat protein [bacterium]
MDDSNKFRRLCAAAIGLAAVLAFLPALRNGFVHDDRIQVQELAVPRSFAEWVASPAQPWWPPSHHKNLWRPVTRVTILIQKSIHDNTGWPFYAVNILLHAAASVLLWLLALRLGFSPMAAFLAGLMFAIHPIHAEAVHQIVGRAEILSAIFILAGLLLSFKQSPAGAPAPHWTIAIVQMTCFALALGSKESAVIYPFLLACVMIAQDGFAVLRRPAFWLRMVLLGVVLALFLACKAAITGGLIEPAASVPYHENPLAHMPFFSRLPAGLGILLYAVFQLVLPLGLSPDFSAISLPIETGWRWPLAWLGALFALALIAWAIRNARRGRRAWLIPAAALGAWLPLSNIVFPIGVVTAERLWYLPSTAACLGMGMLLSKLWSLKPELSRIRSARILSVALLGSWFLTSLVYARAWRDQAGYAEWTIRRFPESWRGHVGLAREDFVSFGAARISRFNEGMAEARRAIEIMPQLAAGWYWLGANATFAGADYWKEAESSLMRALALDPNFAEAHQQLATLYEMQGRKAEAIHELETYLASGQAMRVDVIRKRIERLK